MRLDTYLSEEPDTGYQAYLEGRQARREGLPASLCPYAMGEERKQFLRGWDVQEVAQRLLHAH